MTAIANLLSQMHGSPNSISQMASMAALRGDQSFIARNTAEFERRRNLVVDRIGRMKGLQLSTPAGSFYALVNCVALLGRRRAEGPLMKTERRHELVLLDPPYGRWGSLQPVLAELLPGVVADGGIVVVESDARDEPAVPLDLVTTRRYGSARLTVFTP
jgi:aspartate aminotransferase